jgi:flagellar hook protein FlgE
MSILGALSTSVSGLSAQSYALENISGNIANA